MIPWYEKVIVIAAIVVVFVTVGLGAFYAFGDSNTHDLVSYNFTNTTDEMLLGDNWTCGYITNITTLEDVRSCFK
jgi:hypothetical protein